MFFQMWVCVEFCLSGSGFSRLKSPQNIKRGKSHLSFFMGSVQCPSVEKEELKEKPAKCLIFHISSPQPYEVGSVMIPFYR